MNTLTLRVALLLCVPALFTGCADRATDPLSPLDLGIQAAKPGSAVNLVADVVPDAAFSSSDAQLASSCAGSVTSSYAVLFGHTGCLIVTPTGSEYSLTDDVSLYVGVRKGQATRVQVFGQDVIGRDGIQHESDAFVISPTVPVNPNGFVLHVHADKVPVWRLSGHIGGKRVEMIGTIAIGDIVYRK